MTTSVGLNRPLSANGWDTGFGYIPEVEFTSTTERQSRRLKKPPLYVADHSSLLKSPKALLKNGIRAKHDRVDAMAVPAGRDAEHLRQAIDLASRAARMLIVLCSRECDPFEVRSLVAKEAGFPVLIVDMRDYVFPGFSESVTCLGTDAWPTDTALKRNAAMLLAKAIGARHLLFMDDDVSGMDPNAVRANVTRLADGEFRVAGWSFEEFPDNSAISHAYAGLAAAPFGDQACFIGGGGMLLSLDRPLPHFPMGVYNEDWLFYFPMLRDGSVRKLGALEQDPYNPYQNSKTAVDQEFGDCLAEELFSALSRDDGRSVNSVLRNAREASFWEEAIGRRQRFLSSLTAWILEEMDMESYKPRGFELNPDSARKVLACVGQVRAAAAVMKPDRYARWVSAWRQDERCWRSLWQAMAPPSGNKLDQGVLTRQRKGIRGLGLDQRLRLVIPRSAPFTPTLLIESALKLTRVEADS